jgi:hypothetical protein
LHLYDAAVREALIVLWEASDRVCGKRLKPLIPILLEALERRGHLHPAGDIRARLLAVSASNVRTGTRASQPSTCSPLRWS